MGANRKIETLWDLTRGGTNVAAFCACGHRGVLDGARLSRMFFVQRWDVRAPFVRLHLRCSKCGARPGRVGLTWALPDGPAWGPRDDAGWKRLIARLRG